ncbi:DUF3127 domain-containing protein [Flavobacterium agricola]|uniref:DUF3127 domain-containing protein n=1 Tax=Flavobacterium agricola TaxID=2870839 RepID=A0ABY6M2Q5_9FLAO|nr:DUF3127 domain-containing protein [Flavobacterium agricola]UYW02097.1 DUF3127 domain-containing protein [Flavobacterium agricola]
MEISGNIRHIGQTIAVTQSFNKRELVVTTEEQYPQSILIEFHQDKCSLLDGLILGTAVKVGINLRGREWANPQGETKYFNTIVGWRVEKLNNQSAVDNYQARPQQTVHEQAAMDLNGDTSDDLPF